MPNGLDARLTVTACRNSTIPRSRGASYLNDFILLAASSHSDFDRDDFTSIIPYTLQ